MNLKLFFMYLGGLIAFCTLLKYAYKIWTKKVEPSTPASWVMWTVLNALLLGTTLANNQPGWLPGAWTVGATSVMVALLVRGKWVWSYKETLSAIGAAACAYVWLKYGALVGLLAGIAAMNAAGVPNFIDLWRKPIRGTWPVWGFTVVACFCTLLGSDWSFKGVILPVTSIFFNSILLLVVLFKKPRAENQATTA